MKILRRTLIKIAAGVPFALGGKLSARDFKADDPARVESNAKAIRSRTQDEIVAESRRIAPILSDIIARAGQELKPGDTTRQIDHRLIEALSKEGLASAMLGHGGYPAASAISVDQQLINSIPGDTVLQDGSTVTIELGCSTSLAYAMQGWTFPVGCLSPRKSELLAAAQSTLTAGINEINNGVTPRQIGKAIADAAKSSGHHIIRDFCGYTMGQERIQKPNILNYDAGSETVITPGIILNVYVIVKTGPAGLRVLPDNSVVTRNGEIGAVATAMVVVEPSGRSVLTRFLSHQPTCKF